MPSLRRLAALSVAAVACASDLSAQTSFTYTTRGCISATTCTVSSGTTNPYSYSAATGATIYFRGVNGASTASTNGNGYVSIADLGSFLFLTETVQQGSTVTLGGYNAPLTFKLWIDFTAPNVIGDPVTFSAALSGTLYENSDRASIDVNFNPNSTGLSYTTAGAPQPFRLFVDDKSTPNTPQNYSYYNYNYSRHEGGDWQQGASSLTLTGAIDCSPRLNDGRYTATSTSGVSCTDAMDPNLNSNVNIQSTVPEPSTYALMAAGLLSLGVASRRRRRAA